VPPGPAQQSPDLAASFGREAFLTLGTDALAATPLGPIRAAYAIRWLELGGGASLPAWTSLVTATAG
jgi:hypothetical protein